MAYSKEDRKQVFKFFESILLSISESEIYYDHLRGHVSKAPEIVQKYVRKECKGENLLQYFKKRKNYFVVNEYFVGLKIRSNTQSSDNLCETEVSEYDDEYYGEADDANDFVSCGSSRSNSMQSSILSVDNYTAEDGLYNISKVNDDVKMNEEHTLRYFCKKLEDSYEKTVDSINVDSKKAKRYLKKYMKNSVTLFLRSHPEIFYIDDENCVSLISNPFLKIAPYHQEVQSVSLESSAVHDITGETVSDCKEQTIENVLNCVNFFVKILKKSNSILIERLSGYLSSNCEVLCYLKANYNHFSQFFYDIPQMFVLEENETKVSLSSDSARLLKNARKLYSRYKIDLLSMPLQDAVELLFSIGIYSKKRCISENDEVDNISDTVNPDSLRNNFSEEDDNLLLNTLSNNITSSIECSISEEFQVATNHFSSTTECSTSEVELSTSQASSCTEGNISKEVQVTTLEIEKEGPEYIKKYISMMSGDFKEENVAKLEAILVSAMSNFKLDGAQKSTVPENKSVLSRLENLHCSVSKFSFADNKILRIMLSWEGFLVELYNNFVYVSDLYASDTVNKKCELFNIPSREDMSTFVDILYTIELLCLEKVEKECTLKLNFEYEAVKFFVGILEKKLKIGCALNNLVGSLGQASPDVISFIKQLYKGEKIQDFFESHKEFIVNSQWVKLSPSYKKTLRDKLLQHEQNTKGKNTFSLRNLYNSDWFKDYADAFECFSQLFCFLAKKEKHRSKICRLSGVVSKLSPAQQNLVNLFNGKGLVEKIESFLSNFRIFSYPSDGCMEIDHTIHIPFLRHCFTEFLYLLKDKETKLSNFCYLLNDCSNNEGSEDTESIADLKCSIIKSVEIFLSMSSFLSYSTLPAILSDNLYDLMEKQIFSFGVIYILEECGLFEIQNGKISLKKNIDELDHSGKKIDGTTTDINDQNSESAEINQIKTNMSDFSNAVEYELETSEADLIKNHSDENADPGNETSESPDVDLHFTADKYTSGNSEVTHSKYVEDVNKTNTLSYIEKFTEGKISENEEISENGPKISDSDDVTEEILEKETVDDKVKNMSKLKEVLVAEKVHFLDICEENDKIHHSDEEEPILTPDHENDDEAFHSGNKCESDSADKLREDASSSVTPDSSLIEEICEKISESNSSEEIEIEMYSTERFSPSKVRLEQEFNDKRSEEDLVPSDSLTENGTKEAETYAFNVSPLGIQSLVSKVQKVANIEVLSISTYQKKSPVNYLAPSSESFTSECETGESGFISMHLNCDSKLNDGKVELHPDFCNFVYDAEKCPETVNSDLLTEQNTIIVSLNGKQVLNADLSDEPDINDKLEINENQFEEPKSKDKLENNVKQIDELHDKFPDELKMYKQAEEHEINDKLSNELEISDKFERKSFTCESEIEETGSRTMFLNCDSEVNLCTNSDNLIYEDKNFTNTENDPNTGCFQIVKKLEPCQSDEADRNFQDLSPEKSNVLSKEDFKMSVSSKEKLDIVDMSGISSIKSNIIEGKKDGVTKQLFDCYHSDKIIEYLTVNSLEEKIISDKEKESVKVSGNTDDGTIKNEDDMLIYDSQYLKDMHYADLHVPGETKTINNSAKITLNSSEVTNSSSRDLSVSTLPFSMGSSRNSSDQNDNVGNRNHITNRNLNATFFQPLPAKVVLLTRDSCIAETTIEGNKKLVFCFKSSFHCDQHTDCLKCFDSLAIDDTVSCYILPEENCKLGNMVISFMMCIDTAVTEEECPISNLSECKGLNKGSHFTSQNSKESLLSKEDSQINDISKAMSGNTCTKPNIHSLIDKDSSSQKDYKECQTEYSDFIQIDPFVKEFCEMECQTDLSGTLQSYSSAIKKEYQVKQSSLSKDTGCQTVYKSSECECQTLLSGDIKLCASLIEKECQVTYSLTTQDTQTINNSSHVGCQTELSGNVKHCSTVYHKQCQANCEVLPQGTQTVNKCNEEECQTEISGNIKSYLDTFPTSCQSVVCGEVKKCVNFASKSCHASLPASLSQTTQTCFLDSSSRKEYISDGDNSDWASTDIEPSLPEASSSKGVCDATCQTISTGPVIIKKFHLF